MSLHTLEQRLPAVVCLGLIANSLLVSPGWEGWLLGNEAPLQGALARRARPGKIVAI